MATERRKSFYPLESSPDVFNELVQLLGASPQLAFDDVLSLDDPELLPHPALALVLVLPDGPLIKSYAADAPDAEKYSGSGADEPVVWFKQTIYNACGLYAILHALSNGEALKYLGKLGNESAPKTSRAVSNVQG
jgi:ubiquitin carboxyl-terminal hydrolase L3